MLELQNSLRKRKQNRLKEDNNKNRQLKKGEEKWLKKDRQQKGNKEKEKNKKKGKRIELQNRSSVRENLKE